MREQVAHLTAYGGKLYCAYAMPPVNVAAMIIFEVEKVLAP